MNSGGKHGDSIQWNRVPESDSLVDLVSFPFKRHERYVVYVAIFEVRSGFNLGLNGVITPGWQRFPDLSDGFAGREQCWRGSADVVGLFELIGP